MRGSQMPISPRNIHNSTQNINKSPNYKSDLYNPETSKMTSNQDQPQSANKANDIFALGPNDQPFKPQAPPKVVRAPKPSLGPDDLKR